MEKLYSPERRRIRLKFYRSKFWKKVRANQLRKAGLCEHCLKKGKLTLANTVNHLDPSWSDWASFLKGPFESLCGECHQRTIHRDLRKLKKAELTKQEVWDV